MMSTVIMVSMVATTFVSAAFRLEWALHLYKVRSEAKEHLLDEQPPVRKLHGISFGHGNRFPKSEKDLLALIRSHANAAAVAPVKIESERACRFFLRPASGESVN
jgi:hypothetical protein